MSISSMTKVAALRLAEPPSATVAPPLGKGAVHPTDREASAAAAALDSLVTYIPTEILTLYVAFVGLIPHPACPHRSRAEWLAFACFFVATPLVVWLVYAGRLRSAGRSLPLALRFWPRWEMFAATLAYSAWAFGLPYSPLRCRPWFSPGVASFMILVVSIIIALLAPIVNPPNQATAAP